MRILVREEGRLHGERYETIMGSDVARDGMFLDLRDRPSNDLALWAFYSDADGSFAFTRYRADVPPEMEAWFRQEARLPRSEPSPPMLGGVVRPLKEANGPMREPEWLKCANPWAMLDHLSAAAAAERKERLVLVACCRSYAHWTANTGVPLALAAAERYADGLLAASTLRRYRQKVGRVTPDGTGYHTGTLPTAERQATNLCILAATSHGSAGWQPIPQVLHPGILRGDFPPELTRQLPAILREIFGNPFRPVVFSPEWRTSTVAAIAEAMYELRDFAAMPILADALEDAGCDDEQLLGHCRSPGSHVRGCWVVDLVLARE
jgi:hypothetical protein